MCVLKKRFSKKKYFIPLLTLLFRNGDEHENPNDRNIKVYITFLDLALRCLLNSLNTTNSSSNTVPAEHPCKGAAFALCCHHRCDWNSYTGKKAFTRWGLTARDFNLMCSMTSWATCNLGKKTEKIEEKDENKDCENISDGDVNKDENVVTEGNSETRSCQKDCQHDTDVRPM